MSPTGCRDEDATLWGPAGHPRGRQPPRLAEDRRADARRAAADRTVRRRRARRRARRTSCCSAWAAPRLLPRSSGGHSPSAAGGPRLHVLDSTDAARIAAVGDAIDPARTLFIVSSKSGGTIEPLSLFAHFYSLAKTAPTSPRSPTPAPASASSPTERDFRHIFFGDPDIGGRYSALSPFGIVPATLIGVDTRGAAAGRIRGLGDATPTARMPVACPGAVWLGAALGAMARDGPRQADVRDRRRRCPASGCGWSSSSPSRPASTGRASCRSPTSRSANPHDYGEDRVFVHLPDPAAPDADASTRAGRAGRGRTSGDHDPHRRAGRSRSGLPAGRAGRRSGRLGPADQPLRPAERAAGQGRDQPRSSRASSRAARCR